MWLKCYGRIVVRQKRKEFSELLIILSILSKGKLEIIIINEIEFSQIK